MTDYKGLAKDALKRVPVWLDPKGKHTTHDLARALEATLARLEAAEKAYIASDEYIEALILAESNPDSRDHIRDARTKSCARFEAKKAWREAKSS